MSVAKPKAFQERDEEERDELIAQVWCDTCGGPVRSLDEPVEYQGNGLVLLEGRCPECGEMVIMELAE
jgi:hypothetical protein